MVFLDANPVIYLIEQPANLGSKVTARVSDLLASGERLAVSDLVRVPHTGKGASVVRSLVSTRPGTEESATKGCFRAWGLRHQTIACRLIRVLADLEHPMDEIAARRRRPTPREGKPLYIVT
jgi:hypothetical protein